MNGPQVHSAMVAIPPRVQPGVAAAGAGAASASAPRALRFPDQYEPKYAPVFESLRKHGYVVIPAILSPGECTALQAEVWTWLESLPAGILRDRVDTWKPKQWITMIHGIIKGYGIGQQEFMWKVRTHKRVQRVFKKLWGTKKLVCSFDGMSLHRPKEFVPSLKGVTTRANAHKPTNWMHVDHTPENRNESVQSFVSLYENTAEDGCLMVYDASHKLFDEFFALKRGVKPCNWYKYTQEDHVWMQERGCKLVRVAAPMGSMVLWNSKTVHSSAYAMEDRPRPTMRMVLYACMVPRSCISPRTQIKRRQMVLDGLTTSHSPIDPKKNEVVPRHPMLKGEEARDARVMHYGLLRKRKWDEIDVVQQKLI